MLKKRDILFIIILLLSSCSGLKNTTTTDNDTNDIIVSEGFGEGESLESVSEQLEQLTAAALKAGPSAVDFLASDMFLKASSAQLNGDYATASFIYKHLLKLTPNETFIKKKYAVSLIKAGNLNDAEEVLASIYKLDKSDEKMGLILAGVKSGLGKIDEAKKVYLSVLKQHPNSEDGCLFLSKMYVIEERFKDSLDLLSKCEKKASKENKSLFTFQKGKVYLEQGKLEKSLKFFQKAYAQNSELSEALLATGLIHEEKGQTAQAISLYKKHLKKYPNDETVLTRTVQVLFAEEKYKDVIPYAQRLIDLEPDNLNLKVKLGIVYSDRKKYDQAIGVFKDVLAYAPESDRILYYLAAIYQEKKDFENAIDYFGKVNSESALFSDSMLQIANMLHSFAYEADKTNKEQAQQRLLDFIGSKLGKSEILDIELKVVEANFYERNNKIEQAIGSLELFKGKEDFTHNHKYYLASLYEKIKDYESAEKIVQTIIEEDPENAHAWNFIGYSYLVRGINLEKAFEYINKAVNLNPKDGYIRDSLGWYYFQQGHYSKALKEIQVANKHAPGDTIITKHLAQIYQALKKYNKAKQYYAEALKVCKEPEQAVEIKSLISDLEKQRVPANK